MSLSIKSEVDSVLSVSNPKKSVTNSHLQTIQKRIAFATVLVPSIGLVVAIALLFVIDISWVDLSLLAGMSLLTVIGVEVGLHRHFSHRSFQAKTSIRVGLAVLGSMAAEGPVIYWVSHHRMHHQYSDACGDPHSPCLHGQGIWNRLRGLWHAHVGWLFNSKPANPLLYCKDLLQDRVIARVNQLYLFWLALGLVIPAILGGILTWSWLGIITGMLWGGLVRICLVHHITWSVNSFGHFWGSRPFDTGDCTTNNIWLAIPSVGGSWHNNHHAFPSSAINSLVWWQLDLGGFLIRGLEKLSLVWNVKAVTAEMIKAKQKKTM